MAFTVELLPCSTKVDVLDFVVAPPGVDGGAEAPVLDLLQGGEAVFEEALEARLGGLQEFHVFHPAMDHRHACWGRVTRWVSW